MIVSIHQPNYLPWLGYFRKILQSDVFVFFDNVQMPRGKSFISRNAIKGTNGKTWLTVPVSGKSKMLQISDVEIADDEWVKKHLRTLQINYARSKWSHIVDDLLSPVLTQGYTSLADLNIALVRTIVEVLGGTAVRFVRATELGLSVVGAESIPGILSATGATVYLTGAGKGTSRHLDEQELLSMNIKTEYVSSFYREYPQLHGPYVENLSIVDALLNCGPEATAQLLLDTVEIVAQ